MQLFFSDQIEDDIITLDSVEAKHCTQALRKKMGDIIDVTDGKGNIYKAQLFLITKKSAQAKITTNIVIPKPKKQLHLIIAPLKNMNRVEWMVEKAVEIGVSKISFVITQNCERGNLKIERINKVALSACKQSLKSHFPIITPLNKLKTTLETLEQQPTFIAHCKDLGTKKPIIEALQKCSSANLFIGPEGDFTIEEVEAITNIGAQAITLGEQRLRTETAAIFAVSAFHLAN